MPAAPPPTEPRKRPRQARAQATWEALVEAAAQLLAQDGLARLTTNAVAARAGVSIGSLYQYFPNRDALMLALIERQQAQQAAALASAFARLPAADLRASVALLIRAAMEQQRANPLLATAIDHEEVRLPAAALVEQTLVRAGAALADLFTAHREELGSIDEARAAVTLPAMVRAIIDRWTNDPMLDPDAAEEEAVRAVIGYLTLA